MTRIVSSKVESAVPAEAPLVLEKAPVPAGETTTSFAPSEGEEERLARLIAERERVAMSVPSMKMSAPDIPGFKAYWFNDDEGRVERAKRAGYVHVDAEEVSLHDFSVAGDSTKTGNQDMGSHVSMVVGTNKQGQPMRGYLMKIREEVWKIDQMLLQRRNDQIAQALKAGRIGTEEVSAADLQKTYVRTDVSQTDRRLVASPGQKMVI
jgi:hypothetical protein